MFRLLARWLTLFALVTTAVSAAAETTTTAAADTAIEFWDFPHLPKVNQYIQRTIARFEEENPGVRIRYTRLPWQDGQQKVILAVTSGKPPDVCGQVNVSPQFILQDVLEPLNPWLKPVLDDFYPSYLQAVTYRGNIYAVPWYKACYIMVLNLDLFAKFGVEPPRDGRWTWDEFVQKAHKLTQYETPDGQLHPGIKPAAVKGRQYYGLVTNLGPAEYEAYSIIFNAGGRILKELPDGKIVSALLDPGFLKGLKRLVSLEYTEHVCMPGIGAMTQEQSWNVWRDSRTCAAGIQGGWCITAIQNANKEIEATNARKRAAGRAGEVEQPFRAAYCAPPSDSGTTPVLASSGMGTYVVFRQSDARKRDLCAKFAMELTSGEGQQVLKDENVYPARRSAGNLWKDDPSLSPVFELYPDGIMNPLVAGGERVDKGLQQEVQKALLSNSRTGLPQVSAENAVEAANRKVTAILQRAAGRFELTHEARP